MQKLLLIVLAVLGAWFVVPFFFPVLHHVIFHVGQFGITWAVLLVIVTLAIGLKASVD